MTISITTGQSLSTDEYIKVLETLRDYNVGAVCRTGNTIVAVVPICTGDEKFREIAEFMAEMEAAYKYNEEEVFSKM